jgi:hypothetical protein
MAECNAAQAQHAVKLLHIIWDAADASKLPHNTYKWQLACTAFALFFGLESELLDTVKKWRPVIATAIKHAPDDSTRLVCILALTASLSLY